MNRPYRRGPSRGSSNVAGRYPLAVGDPVLSIVDTLVPRVSTLTRFARYYALLADLAARRDIG
jgi:hypothetical protein